jgi:hypothetical protein
MDFLYFHLKTLVNNLYKKELRNKKHLLQQTETIEKENTIL